MTLSAAWLKPLRMGGAAPLLLRALGPCTRCCFGCLLFFMMVFIVYGGLLLFMMLFMVFDGLLLSMMLFTVYDGFYCFGCLFLC
jgi:hypothetical protein